MPVPTNVYADASADLAAAQRDGSVAGRDVAIATALTLLADADADVEPATPGRTALGIAVTVALRGRWRDTADPADLSTASTVIAGMEADLAGESQWADAAAEYSRVLLEVATALETGAYVRDRRPTPEEQAAFTAQATGAVRDAARMGRAAIAAARTPKQLADGALALGMALRVDDDADGASRWLRRSIDAEPTVAARWSLAESLTDRFDDGGNDADKREALQLLDGIATDPAVGVDRALDADRWAAMWSAAHGDWQHAARAATRALELRDQVRKTQADERGQRAWLDAVGALPSLAALAIARAGDPRRAVTYLDAALATELTDRLGSVPIAHLTTYADIEAVARDEPIVYVVAGPYVDGSSCATGMAILLGGPQPVCLDLPDLTSAQLGSRLMAYATSYAQWKTVVTSPDARARFATEIVGMLDWLGVAVMAPVMDVLPPGAGGLTVVTDGLLGLLPLAAATVGDRRVIDRLALRVAPSVAALRGARPVADAALTPSLLVSVAEVPGQIALPYATAEICAAAAIVGANASTEAVFDGEATVDTVQHAMTESALVHLACHGMTCFDDPRQSYLLLARGDRLTMSDVADLRLTATRLCILSACESGIPEVAVPTEKLSLPVGLMLSGVAGVIASLWSVDDRSTMLLMTRLHQGLQSGLAPSAALRAAQLWLATTPTKQIAEWVRDVSASMLASGSDTESARLMASAVDDFERAPHYFADPFRWAGFGYFGA